MSFQIETLIRTVRQIAAGRPQVTYSGRCSYSDETCSDGTVGCIFGQAFVEMGVNIPTYLDLKTIHAVFDGLAIKYNDNQSRWCSHVQRYQDSRQPWEECIKKADKYLLEYVLQLEISP